MSKIIQLTAEHVKRLNVVEIKPDGNVIVIGGRNGQGKSSVLDSIVYALGGDPADPMPVHRGEEKAKVVVDLGDIIVQRTITAAGGGQLVVKNKDGVKQSSPQQLLDGLVGRLTFDPLDFARQKPPKQADILRGIVGLDFTEHDKKREKTFEQRTISNREAKALEARMNGMKHHADAPEAEQSAAAILEEQRKAAEINQQNQNERNRAKQLGEEFSRAKNATLETDQAVRELERQIAELQGKLAQKQEALKHCRAVEASAYDTAANAAAAVEQLKDVDLAPFGPRLLAVEQANQKLRDNKQRAAVVEQYKAKTRESEDLTATLEAMDAHKRKATAEAKYPVEGLMWGATGVSLNGIPFEQCSSAEQLRVSVAIGLALNPKLRVLLIRDGSLLDEESLKLLVDMAAKADAQIWLERVGVDAQTSVIIEDGSIVEEK